MSSRRAPAPPPILPGYKFLSVLGSGGFSDVYLYEQDRPRRKVAVKVLTADLKTEGARASFESEANLMAQVSAHPYIVTIFEAEITDSGHSYLAMEYCSRPSLDVQYRQGRSSVDKALEIGIQVASAVETAHRAGIAHRDIKPANILVTDYNRPALTDFGISGTMDAVQSDGGMSIPWSPPESFGTGATDGIKVDVWALGATIYTLLAGHSPFVIPGADNSQRMLMDRIATVPLPALGRADVPATLERVLATAMAKSPASRYGSAKDFARALMRVQTELNLSVTPFEVRDDTATAVVPADDHAEATRVRSVLRIDPDASTGKATFPTRNATPANSPAQAAPANPAAQQGAPHRPADPSPVDPSPAGTTGLIRNAQTVQKAAGFAAEPPNVRTGIAPTSHPDSFVLESTVHRSAAPSLTASPASAVAASGRRRLWLAVGSGLVLGTAVVVGMLIFNNAAVPTPDPAAPTSVTPPPAGLILGNEVPAVTELAATAGEGGTEWSWSNPDPQDGDQFLWAPVTLVETGEFKALDEAHVFVANGANNQSCISVKLLRKSGETSAETKKCSP